MSWLSRIRFLLAATLALWANQDWAKGQPNFASLAGLQSALTERGSLIGSFWVEVQVCAVFRDQRVVALQDDSAVVLVELPVIRDQIQVGQQVVLEGSNCAIKRGRHVLQFAPSDSGSNQPILRVTQEKM